jgi:transaldolase
VKFFLDTAGLDELRTGVNWGIVDGVTTNPTLIAKEGKPFEEHIREICDVVDVDGYIGAEPMESESAPMIEHGRELAKMHENVVVKCPLTRQGIKAAAALSGDGIRVNVTLCFSAAKAIVADLIRSITQIYSNHGYATKVLAASLFHDEPAAR